MVVKTIAQIPHEAVDIQKLLEAVQTVFSLIISKLILHIEGLGHVKAVQPDLIGINRLMPEIAGRSTGLCL